MRIVPRHHQSDRRMALSLSSMIDVVFLLLAYFLITTVVTQREDRLTPNLQLERDASGGETQDFEPQVVEVLVIDSSVVFRIGGRDFTDRGASEGSGALHPGDRRTVGGGCGDGDPVRPRRRFRGGDLCPGRGLSRSSRCW